MLKDSSVIQRAIMSVVGLSNQPLQTDLRRFAAPAAERQTR
ncbi:MAG: hypothetical protein ACI9EF_001410 [Pseudohongiellaceae bacterium]|jgi:hypothetical protein